MVLDCDRSFLLSSFVEVVCCHVVMSPFTLFMEGFFIIIFSVELLFFGVCGLLSSEVCDRMENRREMSLGTFKLR